MSETRTVIERETVIESDGDQWADQLSDQYVPSPTPTHGAAVGPGLVDTLHGQHVVDARVQTHLVHYGDARLLSTAHTLTHVTLRVTVYE